MIVFTKHIPLSSMSFLTTLAHITHPAKCTVFAHSHLHV